MNNADIVGNNANLSKSTRRLTIHDIDGEAINVDFEIEGNTLMVFKDSQEISMEFSS